MGIITHGNTHDKDYIPIGNDTQNMYKEYHYQWVMKPKTFIMSIITM